MLTTAQDSFGSLDILVNNAGITADAMAHNMTDEQWDLVCDVALKGTFNLCRAAFPLLRGSQDNPPGHHRKVVNMASINGIYGIAGNVNYSAAKGGVIALTKSLAREWARHRINVNAVAPGYIAGTRLTGARDDDTGLGIPRRSSSASRPRSPLAGLALLRMWPAPSLGWLRATPTMQLDR